MRILNILHDNQLQILWAFFFEQHFKNIKDIISDVKNIINKNAFQ